MTCQGRVASSDLPLTDAGFSKYRVPGLSTGATARENETPSGAAAAAAAFTVPIKYIYLKERESIFFKENCVLILKLTCLPAQPQDQKRRPSAAAPGAIRQGAPAAAPAAAAAPSPRRRRRRTPGCPRRPPGPAYLFNSKFQSYPGHTCVHMYVCKVKAACSRGTVAMPAPAPHPRASHAVLTSSKPCRCHVR